MNAIRYFFMLCVLLASGPAFAQADTTGHPGSLRISILTCGTGDELYSAFGHTGIRVTDSLHGTDEVYNYGTFDFSDPDFYSKFTRGKLLYYLDKSDFGDFMTEYVAERRSVQEQVLQLPEEKKEAIRDFLENNLRPENRSYHYDFLFDNCATRIRDVFPHVLGDDFYYGAILGKRHISYRTVINQYLAYKHWARFGINLLLGSRVDSIMTDNGSMFLPDFLHRGFADASYKARNIVQAENNLLPEGDTPVHRPDGPLWMMIGLLILTVLAFHVKAFAYLKPVIRWLLLFVSGLLGCFMLFMWLGTNHLACGNNFNILWALPANLMIAFIAHKKSVILKIYGLVGISMLLVAMLMHVFGLQKMPLIELTPFLLCLMYVYLDLYKNNVHPVAPAGAAP